MDIPNQREVVSALYANVDGHRRAATDDQRQLRNPASIYGELTPAGVQQLLEFLALTERDVFYDLGSGVGKVVLQAAMATPARKCVGIEVIASRCASARRVLRTARDQGRIRARSTTFRNESFLDSDLSDATAIFACSTCFTANLMRRFARKLAEQEREMTVVTLREFERKHRGFTFVRALKLRTSWSQSELGYVYQVRPPGK